MRTTAISTDDDGPTTTSLDNDDYLDFLIAGYDPDETPPDPHDRFPRNHRQPTPAGGETGPANAEPPADAEPPAEPTATGPPDDPPPF